MVRKRFGYYPRIKHGEGATKMEANATALLASYGHTAEEIAALASADETGVKTMFDGRFKAIETDVLARSKKGIEEAARIAALKDAHFTSEKRIRETYAELGIEIKDEDLNGVDEKKRLETLVSIGGKRIQEKATKTGDNPSEELKALQLRVEAERKAATEASKAAKEFRTKYEELELSLPKLREAAELEVFAEQGWKSVALEPKMLETLIETVRDEGVLTNMIMGHMAANGHKFIGEKTSTGGKALLVVDKDGNPIPMTGIAGNHTPSTYIQGIYEPLVKKSNGGGGGQTTVFKMDGADFSKMDAKSQDAIKAMMKQMEKK